MVLNFTETGLPTLQQKKGEVYLDHYVDNKKVELNSYIQSVLTEKKFIQNDSQSAEIVPKSPVINASHQSTSAHPKNQAVLAEVSAQLASLGYTND